MKGLIRTMFVLGTMAMLGACSSMTTIAERETYAQPKWYAKCAESGTEGWFWWKEEYAYSCGAGESIFQQGAEEQMYAIAMNGFAKRINGTVNSKTDIKIVNDTKNTSTYISYVVKDTTIREHIAKETGTFTLGGKFYTFVKLRMPKQVFDTLIQEARSDKVAVLNN